MNAFKFFKFITGLFRPSFFPTKNRLFKNWSFYTEVFWMTPFFNIDSISFVNNQDSCVDIFGWWGTFSWNGFKMKSIFWPDTHSKILGLLVNFFQCFTKYCSLPAWGKLLIFTFGNKFHTNECISFNWCNGTISGKLPSKSGRRTVSLI